MQVAGEICQLCEHPVLSEVEATACPHCQTVFHRSCLLAPEVCGACGQPFDGNTESAAHNGNDLKSHFIEGALAHPRTSFLYRFSLVAVSLGMILLPLFYVALVATFAYGVFFYAVHFYSLPGSAGYGYTGVMLFFLLYLGPLFAGAMLIFFLVKPFFAPRSRAQEAFSLNHADAPQLFALIGWICRSLNAPIPSRLDVDCSVNASAGFRSGFRSMFGNDILLCLGLPLVAGLNLSQLAGIIAHEYGHFSQGTAMRAHYVIRSINGWFYRVVNQRDAWDLILIQASEADDADWRIRAIFLLARAGVGIGRGILRLLMVVGNLLSSFMSRQMEFNADQYALQMAGSETVISTTLRLQQLNLGVLAARKQLVEKWKKEKKLFDQIPDFIVNRANEISADVQERHYARAFKQKTRLFDSHPSDAVRIQRAREAREPGIFHAPEPATSLFTDYPELSRRLTLFFYRDLVGRGFTAESLIPTEQMCARDEHDYAADRENIKQFFLGVATDSRPLVIKENKSLIVRSAQTLAGEIQACRSAMMESLPAAQEAFAEFATAETRLSQADQAAQLLAAGFQFDPSEFGLMEVDAEQSQVEARQTMKSTAPALETFEAVGKTRLTDAVQLLPQLGAVIPNARKLQDEAREMMHVLTRLENTLESVPALRAACAALELVLAYRRAQPGADNAAAVLENLATEIQARVNDFQEQTRQIRYPFQEPTGQLLLNDHLRNKEYHADPFEFVSREGKSHAEKLLNLYHRLLGRLVAICNEVERQIGS